MEGVTALPNGDLEVGQTLIPKQQTNRPDYAGNGLKKHILCKTNIPSDLDTKL